MTGNQPLPAGKLPPDLLHSLLQALPHTDPDLILGPGIGEDAAVIRTSAVPSRLCVLKSDPITFVTDQIGHYALHVCVNDLAVTGARPRFYLPVILFPAGTTQSHIEDVFSQIGAACTALGIAVAGGHTEITEAVRQTVVSGTLWGELPSGQFVTSQGASPGEVLLLTGTIPVEAVSIMARECRTELQAQGWSVHELERAANFLFEPGISILQPALRAADLQLVTAMHDPTEGGIATAIRELTHASQVGIRLDLDVLPIPDLALRLCHALDIDPLGAIASGCLLSTANPEDVPTLIEEWHALGWTAQSIGEVVSPENGLTAYRGSQEVPIPQFAVDEITKLFS